MVNDGELSLLMGRGKRAVSFGFSCPAPFTYKAVVSINSTRVSPIGSRSIFYAIWILSQILLFGLALVHYALKDNLTAARAVFGGSYGQFLISPQSRPLHVTLEAD